MTDVEISVRVRGRHDNRVKWAVFKGGFFGKCRGINRGQRLRVEGGRGFPALVDF